MQPDKRSVLTLDTPELVPADEAKDLQLYGGEGKSAAPSRKLCPATARK
ncbi:hypothetical protein ACFJGW_20360 [Burkholderiaceae bacterium UC74_6]